jgi:hypothetical protein
MFRATGPNASLFVRSVQLNGLSEAAYRDHLVQLTVSDIETGPFIFKDCMYGNYQENHHFGQYRQSGRRTVISYSWSWKRD